MTRPPPVAPPAHWWLRMSHDLRGPVAPIRMAVQMLRMGSMSPAEQAETLRLVDRQVDLLLANIDDMSELLRINAGTFEFKPGLADLGDCFEFLEGRSALMRQLKHGGVTLVTAPWPLPLMARHDPNRLVTVLEFLVSKVARHARSGAELRLSLAQEAGSAVWSIDADASSLVADPEVQYVLGNSSAVDECEGRALLVRELAVLHELEFRKLAPGQDLVFSIPIET
jgi:signal transduction histidine kinase